MSDEPKRELLPGEAEADAWIDTLEQMADAMSDDISDIVADLRQTNAELVASDGAECEFAAKFRRAADEIERLREEVSRLTAALSVTFSIAEG